MQKKNIISKKLIFLLILTILIVIPVTVFAITQQDLNIGWKTASKPSYTIPGSIYTKYSDVTYNRRTTTIMNRLKGSYSYRNRMPKITNFTKKQIYFNAFYNQNNSIDYTDKTYVTTNDKHDSLNYMVNGYTNWYDSPWAIFLDYETRYIKNPGSSVIDWASASNSTLTKPSDVVQDSIDYAYITKKNNISKDGAVYIASTAQSGELADAKIASVIAKDSSKRFPILLDNQDANMYNNELDPKVKSALNLLDVDTIYLLGGSTRFSATAGLTTGYNIVRAGGINRNKTQKYYENLPTEINTLEKLATPDSNGIVFSGSQANKISSTNKTKVKNWLSGEKSTANGTNLIKAAEFLMETYDFGSEPIKTSLPVLTLGVKTASYEVYFILYYDGSDGQFVYQYILDNYLAKNNVTVEYRDIESGTTLKTSNVEELSFGSPNTILSRSYKAPTISGYAYNSCKITSNGSTITGSNPATIKCYASGINKVIFYYKRTSKVSTINVQYKDYDTGATIKNTLSENITHSANVSKTYSAPTISDYDYYSCKVTNNGTTTDGTSTVTISVSPGTSNTIIFYYKQRKSVKVSVEYRDIDTNKILRTPLAETVSIILEKPVEKTYSAPVISGYNYNSSKITSGGTTSVGTNPAKISVKPKGINKVIFYYKKSATKDVGIIKFNPNETAWTNKGKISEGVGRYEVEVFYEGNNPIEDIGRWEKVNAAGEVLAGTFPVQFELKDINVTGAAKATVNGVRGKINIEQEGEKIKLNGEGSWKEPIFQSTETTNELPKSPQNPVGESGYYNIDWTKPNIEVSNPNKKWVNNPLPYKIDVKVSDNLSGFAEGSKVTVIDSSHYKNNIEEDINKGDLIHDRAVVMSDGIYTLDIDANDIAGNKNKQVFEKYLIDGTKPTIEFSVTPKLFSQENGAIKKEKNDSFSYWGILSTQDNLSGVGKIQYKWSYSKDKPNSGYDILYESPYTENDRYGEIINKEIEKPVGDNLYLHVESWDVAGNKTYETFGPFEDPIMLKEFEVTDVRDPRWKTVFWKDDKYKEHTEKAFKVNEMAIDNESHPTLKNALPKKGYAFYFDITSEYLYRDNDRIEIKPSFYYITGNERIRVDCYYNNNNNPLVGFGSNLDDSTINLNTERYGDVLIGNYNKLILTRGTRIVKGKEWNGNEGWKDEIQYSDGKEQWWYGKYYIPSSTFCVKAGDEPTPLNRLKGGNILVNFEIIAYKNGIETLSSAQMFNYNISQWELEGGPKNSNYKNGDVILYNGKYGADTDIKTRVIH